MELPNINLLIAELEISKKRNKDTTIQISELLIEADKIFLKKPERFKKVYKEVKEQKEQIHL